jgi:hypothetical protein
VYPVCPPGERQIGTSLSQVGPRNNIDINKLVIKRIAESYLINYMRHRRYLQRIQMTSALQFDNDCSMSFPIALILIARLYD